MPIARPSFILASASPRRLQLLQQVGIVPDQVIAAAINETPLKGELPDKYALRMAGEKAAKVAADYPDSVVLAADTVVACGRRILPKAEDEKTAKQCLQLLSGRRHRVHTAVCIAHQNKFHTAVVLTQVRFNRLNDKELAQYLASGEWHGKAGGYAIQGLAEAFIPWIGGAYSNVVGLPLEQTCKLLVRVGLKSW